MSSAEETRQYNKLRVERGECIQCKAKHGGKGQRCPGCAKKATDAMRELVERRKREGICTKGAHPNDRIALGFLDCAACAKSQSDRAKVRTEDRKKAGHCKKCPTKTVFGRGLCFDHWCASTANNALGQWDRGPEIKALWTGKCALSGLPLDNTAELDHIIPRSRGGTNDADNLRWVTARANLMKGDQLDEELFIMAHAIFSYLSYQIPTKRMPF